MNQKSKLECRVHPYSLGPVIWHAWTVPRGDECAQAAAIWNDPQQRALLERAQRVGYGIVCRTQTILDLMLAGV